MHQQAEAHRAELILPYGVGTTEVTTSAQSARDVLARDNRLTKAGWKLVGKRVVADFSNDAMVDKGATLTYYTVLSLAPMILAAYSIATLLLPRDEAQTNQLLTEIVARYVPTSLQTQAEQLLLSIIGTPAQSTVALTFSVLFSLVSASAYVRSFSRNANLIYGRTEGRNIVVTWLMMWAITAVLVVGAVVIVLGLLLTENIVNAVLGPIARPLGLEDVVEYLTGIFLPVWSYLRMPVIIVVAIALISVLYYIAPNVKPGRFRVLTLGSSLALLSIGAIWYGFGLYLSRFGVQSAYGAFGTVITVLVLAWVMNIVLLEGVKIDAEVLRAKELQRGYASAHVIQAPPRSSAGVKSRLKMQRWVERSVDEIQQDQANAQR